VEEEERKKRFSAIHNEGEGKDSNAAGKWGGRKSPSLVGGVKEKGKEKSVRFLTSRSSRRGNVK